MGITAEYQVFRGDDDEAKAYVDSVNLHRRHLTAEFRREQAVYKSIIEGKSTRQIAVELNVSPMTVVRDLKAGVTNVTPDPATSTPTEPTTQSVNYHVVDPGPGKDATQVVHVRHVDESDDDGDQDEQDVEHDEPEPTPAPAKVTGRDGKQYPARRPDRPTCTTFLVVQVSYHP